MTDDQNWDDLADDENQWGQPTTIQPTEKAESVVSVRLPASAMERARANARAQGLRLGAYIRYLVVQGLACPPEVKTWEPSFNQLYDGHIRTPVLQRVDTDNTMPQEEALA